jgi:hypothetical protein
MKKFTEVKELVASLEADADKFYNKGNSAAGTRVRKGMQDLKNLSGWKFRNQKIKNRYTWENLCEPAAGQPVFL